MTALIIKDANAAYYFMRTARNLGWRLPTPFGHSNDRVLEIANGFARRMSAVDCAKVMRGYRGKRSGAVFAGVRCDCCNTPLTNPDSILAGRGPKCVEDGNFPEARAPASKAEAAS